MPRLHWRWKIYQEFCILHMQLLTWHCLFSVSLLIYILALLICVYWAPTLAALT